MIYYKYRERVEHLDPSGAYFMPDDMGFATQLLNRGMYSTEVNTINDIYQQLKGQMDDKVFIDVGANVGTYTLVLAPIFKHSYAFEPNKHIYNIMCGNVALYNLSDKTTLVNMGLSDANEELNYTYFDELGGGNSFAKENGDKVANTIEHRFDWYRDDFVHTEKLQVKTLDSFNIKNVGLMKIDVEGFELNVLKGAVETIKASGYPMLIVESWNVEKTDSPELSEAKKKLRYDLFGFITKLGYTSILPSEEDVFICRYHA